MQFPGFYTRNVMTQDADTLRTEGRLSCAHHRIPSVEVEVTNQDGVRIAPFTIRQFADDLLVVVLLLTVPMAILAMRLAEKALKKQASVLNNL